MKDIEIYVQDTEENKIIEWLGSIFLNLTETYRDDDGLITFSAIYQKSVIPIVIQKNIEDLFLTAIWFNSNNTPWHSNKACALEAFKIFRTVILCDPRKDSPFSDKFLEISVTGERIVNI